jgi:hypothetical protein
MKFSRIYSLLLLGGMLLSGNIATAQDQNKSALDSQSDPRLKKTVSIHAPVSTLSDLMAEIGKASGVQLSATREIAAYRACVVVKEQPLEQLMTHLASAFDYSWEKVEKEGGSPVYRLYQSASARQKEQQEVKQVRDRSLALLREALRQMENNLRTKDYETFRKEREDVKTQSEQTQKPLSDRQIQQKLLEYAMSYIDGWDDWIAAGTLLRLSPGDWGRLQQGYSLTFSNTQTGSPVPQDALDLWRDQQLKQLARTRDAIAGRASGAPLILRGGGEGAGDRELSLEDMLKQQEQQTRNARELKVTLRYDTETGQVRHKVEVPLEQEGRGVRTTFAFAINDTGFRFGSPFDTANALNPADWQLAEQIRKLKEGSLPVLPEDLAKRKVAQDEKPDNRPDEDFFNRFAYHLARVAKGSNTSLVAELYPLYPPTAYRRMSDAHNWQTVYEALNEDGYSLKQEGDWVVVSHLQEPFARRYDVAQANLKRWFYDTKQQLSLDIYSEIAWLMDPQIQAINNRMMGASIPQTLGRPGGGQSGVARAVVSGGGMGLSRLLDDPVLHHALRLYGQMGAIQKQNLQKGDVAGFMAMNANQQKIYLETLALKTGVALNELSANARNAAVAREASFAVMPGPVGRAITSVRLGEGDAPPVDANEEHEVHSITFVFRFAGQEFRTEPLTFFRPVKKEGNKG